jgi:hypothetical protein
VASRATSGQKPLEEFGERLKHLVAANLAGNAQLMTRLNSFIKDAATAVQANRPGEATDATALLSRWLDFNLTSYSVVSTHGLALLNELLSAAEGALLPKPPPVAESSPGSQSRVELRLSGRPGERVTSGFAVENHFDHPLSITFECADLTPASGQSLPAALVEFEPANLIIPPHGEAVAHVAVVTTGDFAIGQTYTTTIRLLGFDRKEVGLSITISPGVATPNSSPPPPQAKPRKKPRRRLSR